MRLLTHIVKAKYVLAVLAYSLFLYLIFKNSSIITNNEAEKYIKASQELAKGDIGYTIKHHLFYSSYIFFITPFLSILGLKATIAAQALLNIIAAYCIKSSVEIISPGNRFSFVAALVLLFSYAVQFWTLTLFSDNFFVAIICITLYYTLKKKTRSEFIFWLILLSILTFARPPGVFVSTAFACYYLYANKTLSSPATLLLTSALFIGLFVLLFYMPVETKGYIKPIAAGCIIVDRPDYDVPRFNNIEKSTLSAAYSYLFETIGTFNTIRLYFDKLVSFFTLTRSYYSTAHNSILALHYLLYIMGIVGLFHIRKKRGVFLLFLLTIFLVGNLTALTYNEWHYRFTLAIFPFIIILSAISFNHLLSSYLKTKSKK